MNSTLLYYTYLLPLRKLGKFDLVFHVILFIFCVLYVAVGETGINTIFDFVTSPIVIFVVVSKYMTDKGQAYNALLFTRPITRANFVITKAVIGSIAGQLFVWKILLFTIIAELLLGHRPLMFISGWDIANVVANSFSFSCLSVMISMFSQKVSTWLFLLFSVTLMTPAMTYRPTGPLRNLPMQPAETTLSSFSQIFYPYIDLHTVLNAAGFSIVPVLAYFSNIAIYLLFATWLINRREFSYAQAQDRQ